MKIPRLSPVAIFLYLTSASVAFIGLTVLYVSFVPIDVLKDWTLTVEKKDYRPGDTISVISQSTKVRNAQPESKRYLQCLKDNIYGKPSEKIKDQDWDGYILLSENNTPKPKGDSKTEVDLALPLSIPNVPNTCRVYINICYHIYNFREFCEYNYSNAFTVLTYDPKKPPQSILSPDPGAQSNNNPQVTIYGSPPILDNPNRTSEARITQPSPVNNGLAPNVTEFEDDNSRRGILERTTDSVGGLLNTILDSL